MNKRFPVLAAGLIFWLNSPAWAAEPVKLPPKAERIILPAVVFQQATATDAIRFLEMKAKELDPDGVGVPLRLTGPEDEVTEVTCRVKDIPLAVFIRELARLFDREIQVKGETIELKSKLTKARLRTQSSQPPSIPGLDPLPK